MGDAAVLSEGAANEVKLKARTVAMWPMSVLVVLCLSELQAESCLTCVSGVWTSVFKKYTRQGIVLIVSP